MPTLHLDDVPSDVIERLQRMATARRTTLEAEAVEALRWALPSLAPPLVQSTADLLEEMRRTRWTPPPGAPDSVELIREDRDR
jgi:hypothetical protein